MQSQKKNWFVSAAAIIVLLGAGVIWWNMMPAPTAWVTVTYEKGNEVESMAVNVTSLSQSGKALGPILTKSPLGQEVMGESPLLRDGLCQTVGIPSKEGRAVVHFTLNANHRTLDCGKIKLHGEATMMLVESNERECVVQVTTPKT